MEKQDKGQGGLRSYLALLPPVDTLLSSVEIVSLLEKLPRNDVVRAVRESLEKERKRIVSGEVMPSSRDEIIRRVVEEAAGIAIESGRSTLQFVVNGTGILIHTNLGRAVLSREAIDRVVTVSSGYSTLEYDLEAGSRGSRMVHVKKILSDLTGAEDALVVNNNAAAVMLLLDTFARGREVIVSRGELIEIGGSFRLPDVFKKSGAILREVGCTNKTHLHDYEDNINENTALLLKCHKSNYAITGFTKEVSIGELAELGRKFNLVTVDDLGSGLLIDLSKYGLHGEETIRRRLEAGADIITFSGDKLMGGPQAGIILGRKDLIERMKKNPLMRALRPDKMTIAAIEGTVSLYRDPDKLEERMPFLRMLSQSAVGIAVRIEKMKEKIQELTGFGECFKSRPGSSMVGGGSYPDTLIPTTLLSIVIPGMHPEQVIRRLLDHRPAVIARIEDNEAVIDLRTVQVHEEEIVIDALCSLIV